MIKHYTQLSKENQKTVLNSTVNELYAKKTGVYTKFAMKEYKKYAKALLMREEVLVKVDSEGMAQLTTREEV